MNKVWWALWHREVVTDSYSQLAAGGGTDPYKQKAVVPLPLKFSSVMLPRVCSLWWPKKRVETNRFKKIRSSI